MSSTSSLPRALLFLGLALALSLGLPPAAAAAPAPQDDRVAAERARLELMQEKTFFLVQRYLANARALEERLDFEAAERELEKAREIDPSNRIVIDYLRQIQAILGRDGAQSAALRMSAAERYAAQRQQMRFQALQDLDSAERALAVEDIDSAKMLTRGVMQRIAWTRNEIAWEDIEPRARELNDRVERLAAGYQGAQRQQREAEAYRKLQEEERRLDDQRASRHERLMASAYDRFLEDEFDQARALAEAVLEEDPHNARALELVDAAEDASRDFQNKAALRKRKEQFARWRESMESVRIPNSEHFTAPDDAHWADITAKRGSRAALGLGADPERDALLATLASTRMNADYNDVTLTQVATNIQITTGIPVSVDPEVALDLDDAGETVNLSGLRNVTVDSLLNIITDQVGDELAWTVRNGRVYVTNREKAQGKALPRVHNIQDLTFPLTDFKGVSIRDIPLPGEAGDDTETTIFNSELDRVQLIPPEEILNLVRENIERESWDESDAYNIDFLDNNNLLVVHTPEVQEQVAAFLDDLRRFSTSMVTLEARFFAITDAFLEEIGTDLRGLGPNGGGGTTSILDDVAEENTEGLDNSGNGTGNPNAGVFFDDHDQFYSASIENFFGNPLSSLLSTTGGGAFQFTILDDTSFNIVMRAVEKSTNALEISSPVVSVYNTQRAFMTVVNQVSFIQGFDVDVANAARIADPNIGIVQEGIVLDVRPTISYDRKYITLDVETTVANLVRPIRTFQTNLGGNTESVEFSLPQLDVQDARTTAVVPDGGTLVLGGFKRVFYKNRTATVPWLDNIPILGFFFREKGLADEMTDLIVVIKATITDFSLLQQQTVATKR